MSDLRMTSYFIAFRDYPLVWSTAMSVVSLCISLALCSKIPDPMPCHWGLNGYPDGYMPKIIGLFLLPVIGFLASALLQLATGLDHSNREHSEASKLAIKGAIALPAAFLSCFHIIILDICTQADPVLAVNKLFTPFGVLLLIMSVIFRRVEPNHIVGVTAPWTLQSRQVWNATHVFAGWSFAVNGVLLLILAQLIPLGFWEGFMLAVCLVAPLLSSVVYAYCIRERQMYSAYDWDVLTGAQPLLR